MEASLLSGLNALQHKVVLELAQDLVAQDQLGSEIFNLEWSIADLESLPLIWLQYDLVRLDQNVVVVNREPHQTRSHH